MLAQLVAVDAAWDVRGRRRHVFDPDHLDRPLPAPGEISIVPNVDPLCSTPFLALQQQQEVCETSASLLQENFHEVQEA